MYIDLSNHPLLAFVTDSESLYSVISLVKKQEPSVTGIIITRLDTSALWKKVHAELVGAKKYRRCKSHPTYGNGFHLNGICVW